MDLAKIEVFTDGGPWADHNMPCAVCRKKHAVLDLSCGIMRPCWGCQGKGWDIHKKKSWVERIMGKWFSIALCFSLVVLIGCMPEEEEIKKTKNVKLPEQPAMSGKNEE